MTLPDGTIEEIKKEVLEKIKPEDVMNASDWEDFVSLWMVSKEVDNQNQWFKGDIVAGISSKYGEKSLDAFAEEVKESSKTLEHYRRTSRAFQGQDRDKNLSWTHYLIASFTDQYDKGSGDFQSNERYDWLNKAHDNQWSTGQFKQEIKKQQAFKKDGGVFDYYMKYIQNVRGVLTHIEKDSLTDEEKNKLIQKLSFTYNDFMIYLKDK